MPFVYLKDHIDLVHIPYYSIPIFYPKRFIVTIHDLTILHINTGKATSLPYPLYLMKKVGYSLMMAIGLRRASHIIAVSETTKNEIVHHFGINPEKITVTYEGVDKKLSSVKDQRINQNPYFLYVGNAYPHKNVDILIDAFFEYCRKSKDNNIKLILVGKEDYFYKKLKESIASSPFVNRIVFYGHASDEDLAHLYSFARAFVFPSQMEGFGLPALEALSYGCPLIVSDIPVFREIFDDFPIYVPVNDKEALTETLLSFSKKEFQKKKESGIQTLLSKYQWSSLAKQTLALYEKKPL